jgi:hypothetical protein
MISLLADFAGDCRNGWRSMDQWHTNLAIEKEVCHTLVLGQTLKLGCQPFVKFRQIE